MQALFSPSKNTALSNANKAILLDYKNQDAYFIRGKINIKKPDWISGLNDFKRILEINRTSIDAQTMIGYMESGSGNQKTAINTYSKILDKQPNNSNLYAYRGNIKYQLKDHADSIKDLTKAIELDQEERDIANFAKLIFIDPKVAYSVLYSTLCSSYRHLGNYQSALKACTKVIETGEYTDRHYPYLASAAVKRALGDLGGSCSDYDKALSLGYQTETLVNRAKKVLSDGICLFN